mgnify:FL=1
MTDIVVHTFKDHQVRTAVSSDGEPLFNLGDVAAALEIKDSARLASRLEDDLRQTRPILDRLGRTQNATFITEAGLYEVVLRSDKPEAKPFRRWVTREVLPSIRKTGSYSLQPKLEGPELMAYALIEAQKTIEAATARAEAAEAQIEADKPATTLGKAITAGDGDLLVRDVARILASHGVNIGEKRLYQWLRDNQWVTKGGGRCGNQPTQRRIEQGLVRPQVRPIHLPGGRLIESVTTLITGKGQEDLINGFLNGSYTI